MIMALLKGKLSREQENMEDILTSNVFGALRYVSPGEALLPFLAQAEDEPGHHPLEGIARDAEAQYKFWPRWGLNDSSSCIPDVVIRIDEPTGRRLLILVEAKYWSPKSSEADEGEKLNDQLAREWDCLTQVAQGQHREPVLVYLTSGVTFPRNDIHAAQVELAQKSRQRGNMCWLSWQHLFAHVEHTGNIVLQDLAKLLRHMGLTFFTGFSSIPRAAGISWSFFRGYDWSVPGAARIGWRYKR